MKIAARQLTYAASPTGMAWHTLLRDLTVYPERNEPFLPAFAFPAETGFYLETPEE